MLPAFLLAFLGTVTMWEEPRVPVEAVSFDHAARGVPAPQPPFRFEREETAGTSAKVLIRDAMGRQWQVKGGPEGRADSFATRLVGALGYYADAVWFLKSGTIEGVRAPLGRASGFIGRDGSFTYAAFELRDPVVRYIGDGEWTWDKNPFAGTRELAGLKLLVVLLSNWDNKDARDVSDGSNTGVVELETGTGRKRVYFVNDWGQSLGSWGWFLWFGRSNWNCAEYERQSADFVRAGNGGLRFGYRGQHTDEFSRVSAEDARWLLGYLGRVTLAQLRSGLRASGASPAEEDCLSRAIFHRIELLRRAAGAGSREVP